MFQLTIHLIHVCFVSPFALKQYKHPPLFELEIQTENGNVNGNNDVFSDESLKLMQWSR